MRLISIGTLDARSNAITPLRLGLALLVVFSHTFVASGLATEPLMAVTGGQMQLGSVAVIGFFGLSGFLLARSRERNSVGDFVANRLLRIVPGLWVCLGLTVLVVIPLAVAMGGEADPDQVRQYVINSATFQLTWIDVDGLYGANAHPDWVNGPLWTLPPEIYCYLLFAVVPRRLLRAGAQVVFVLLLGINVLTAGSSLHLHLPLAFTLGIVLYQERDRIPLGAGTVAVAVAATWLAALVGVLAVVAPVTLVYVALWVGLRAPVRWTRDLSYGVYIYGWPIQELLAMAGVTAFGLLPYLGVTLVLLVPVAFLSWTFIEAPMLRLRRAARHLHNPEPPIADHVVGANIR